MSREAIYAALFAKLAAISGLRTSSRRLKHYSDVAPADQPALFMEQTGENVISEKGGRSKTAMKVDVALYVNAGNAPQAVPATTLNQLVDAVSQVLAPGPAEEYQNLGGLVERCWIEGEIEYHTGLEGGQAVAIVPVNILAAA